MKETNGITQEQIRKAVNELKRNGVVPTCMLLGSTCEYTICNKCMHIYKRECKSCDRCGHKRTTPDYVKCLDLPPVE